MQNQRARARRYPSCWAPYVRLHKYGSGIAQTSRSAGLELMHLTWPRLANAWMVAACRAEISSCDNPAAYVQLASSNASICCQVETIAHPCRRRPWSDWTCAWARHRGSTEHGRWLLAEWTGYGEVPQQPSGAHTAGNQQLSLEGGCLQSGNLTWGSAAATRWRSYSWQAARWRCSFESPSCRAPKTALCPCRLSSSIS